MASLPRTRVLLTLFAASMWVNVTLGVAFLRTRHRNEAETPRAAPIAPRQMIISLQHPPKPALDAASPWTHLQPTENLRELAERMRAQGIDPRVIRNLIASLAADRFAWTMADLVYPENKPFWEMGVVHHHDIGPVETQIAAQVRDALGEPVDLRSGRERAIREYVYGNLPDATMERIAQISGNYRAQREAIAPEDTARDAKLAAIGAAEQREIASALTPEEAAEYARRPSAAPRVATTPPPTH